MRAVFTEPGTLNHSTGLYVSLSCHTNTSAGSRVILLRYLDGTWQYKGVLLRDTTDAPLFGYSGIGASAMFENSGRIYLLVTGTTDEIYKNCMLMEILDIAGSASARVDRDATSKPKVLVSLLGKYGYFMGSCSYHPAASIGGILYGEVVSADFPTVFQIFKSFVTPP